MAAVDPCAQRREAEVRALTQIDAQRRRDAAAADPLWGLRPLSRGRAMCDALAGVTLASMNIPQVLGYTRIAETPVVCAR